MNLLGANKKARHAKNANLALKKNADFRICKYGKQHSHCWGRRFNPCTAHHFLKNQGAGLDSMERLSGSYGYEAAPKPAFGKYSSGPDQAIRRWGNSTVGGR
ncbi:hypothetical protein, partial [Ferrovibrio sp.]|uniref:hypothetical protein n=1 Tax=Ferrovibrio sp. TaxID=1917215 RepID=UPI0035B1064D